MRLKALVISPFCPDPPNAGHRLRVSQACRDLASLGFDVFFVHLAFEGVHAWRAAPPLMGQLLPHGIVSYWEMGLPRHVGRPPPPGSVHSLDQWWPPDFEAWLINHIGRNFYDVVVVHNVWLSKALDFFPAGTMRIIETHDLFSERATAFERIGCIPDFFVCSERDEQFGLNRADLVIAIKESDAGKIETMGIRGHVVTIPSRDEPRDGYPRSDYIATDCVTFGFMGSAHPFNMHGINELLAELREQFLDTPAPLRLILAGEVCRHVDVRRYPFVELLGYVDNISDFYSQVDVVVSPLEFGTGVKIKVVECIFHEMPVLSTRHSGEGCFLPDESLTEGVSELARRMIQVALFRPDVSRMRQSTVSARHDISRAHASGLRAMRDVMSRSPVFFLFYDGLTHPDAWLMRYAIVGIMRSLAGRGRVVLIASKSELKSVGFTVELMPPSVDAYDPASCVRAVGHGEFAILSRPLGGNGGVLVSNVVVHSPWASRVVMDRRFATHAASSSHSPVTGAGEFRGLPAFDTSVYWDPVIRRDRFRRVDGDLVLLAGDAISDEDCAGIQALVSSVSQRSVRVRTFAEISTSRGLSELLDSGVPSRIFHPFTFADRDAVVLEFFLTMGAGLVGYNGFQWLIDVLMNPDGLLMRDVDNDLGGRLSRELPNRAKG